jgi:hypothetical protein
MTARILCIGASLLGATVGACWPAPAPQDKSLQAKATATPVAQTSASASGGEVPLDIAISHFPNGYQSRWAANGQGCADAPDTSVYIMSLQGRLVKFHESIGTMVQGKRTTSRAMEAEFEFVGEGQKWTKAMRFEMSPDRQQLTRIDLGDGLRTQYTRCPNLMAG